jgi:molybdopterin molybdotransferase
MIEFEEALARILASVPVPKSERVALSNAAGRILLEDVHSEIDLPPFDNSAVDGYAVRSRETSGATADAPFVLPVAGRASAGEPFSGSVPKGSCVRLFTGSVLPDGMDAVVMQEDTRAAESGSSVQILESVKAWENVRFQGEDVKRGTTLVTPGRRLTAGQIALLSAAGVASVVVGKRPRTGLLATGNELREAGASLKPGEIYESNRPGLMPMLNAAGAAAVSFPIVPDDLQLTRAALERALSECDVVVTCGGVSVGEMDFVKAAFEALGGKLEFWKIAIKPGRPFVLGRLGKKFLFGLPGNSVSAFVTFLLLARPALLRWQGATEVGLPMFPAVLDETLVNDGGRRHFMRVKFDASGRVKSAGIQASHVLSSLAAANGLVDVPPNTTLAIGTNVKVLSWE